MTEIIMVRHGRTDANVAGLLQGRTDSPVRAEELASSPTWGERGLPRPDSVYSSPLRRALQTAEHLLSAAALTVDDRLVERNLGVIDGLAADDLWAERPDIAEKMANDPDYAPLGGESAEEVAARVRSFVAEMAAGPDQLVACVTHGALMAITLRMIVGVAGRPHIANLEAVRLRADADDATRPLTLVSTAAMPSAVMTP